MKRSQKLKYYVFRYDWNSKDLVRCNILNEYFIEELKKEIKRYKINNREQFKERLMLNFRYYYRSKAEHEVLVCDLFPKDYEDFCKQAIKIDIWYQIEPNIDLITDYIIRELRLFKGKENEK